MDEFVEFILAAFLKTA